MTQYILNVTSYSGIVAWATHYRGHVEGPHPDSCHGNTRFNAPDARGRTTCEQGHDIPDRVKWDVEQAWSHERLERYLAACSKALRDDSRQPDGPGQFDTEKDVIDRAIVQFLDGMEQVNDPAEEGDELWFGHVDQGEAPEFWDNPDEVWGMRLASCHRG